MKLTYDCWEFVLNMCDTPCTLSLVCKTWKKILVEKRFDLLLQCMKKLFLQSCKFHCSSLTPVNGIFYEYQIGSGYISPPLSLVSESNHNNQLLTQHDFA